MLMEKWGRGAHVRIMLLLDKNIFCIHYEYIMINNAQTHDAAKGERREPWFMMPFEEHDAT